MGYLTLFTIHKQLLFSEHVYFTSQLEKPLNEELHRENMSLNISSKITWTWFELTFSENQIIYESKYESTLIGSPSSIAIICFLFVYFLQIRKKCKGNIIDLYVILDCLLKILHIHEILGIFGILPEGYFCASRTVAVLLIHSSRKIIVLSIALIR